MAEAKVFPMSTFVSCLKGAQAPDQELIEMLAYVTQNEVDSEFAPVAAALSKAWIYEQEPGLTKYAEGDITALGQKVSIAPLPAADLGKAQAALGILAELKAANKALEAEVAGLTAANKTLEGELAAAKAKVKVVEDQSKAGEQKLEISSKKIDEHIKKLEQLMAEVEKVKQQGVVVAGAAGGGAPAAEGAAGPSAEVGDDFGFSGGGSDPFSDSSW
ncbi:MAG: hypothetical protein PHV85_06095 [Desulfovibrionaceae bacterium]|nr:hypothetical protein [Desulfovibrionaceae bacterium]MDD4952101.1 hypothetical protein [Desulfovibrionaceae bacterium]